LLPHDYANGGNDKSLVNVARASLGLGYFNRELEDGDKKWNFATWAYKNNKLETQGFSFYFSKNVN